MFWTSHVQEYVQYMWHRTTVKGNKGGKSPPILGLQIPLMGPRFEPPTYLHMSKRDPTPDIVPEIAYLKPVTVVHPFYFPEVLTCPRCTSDDTASEG